MIQDEVAFLKSVGGVPVSQGDGQMVWDFGVVVDPKERERIVSQWRVRQIEQALKDILLADLPENVFASDLQKKLLGRVLAAWNQKSVGSCVGHGTGRAFQDTVIAQCLLTGEKFFDAEVCREAVYGGSRVEIGGGRINGDGSVGAWAADYMTKYGGGVLYKKYDEIDLSGGYDEARCRQWGNRGVPDNLEKYAKNNPVKDATMVATIDGLRAAIRSLKFVSICGSKGRTMQRKSGGWCPVSGQWAHCQEISGRCLVQGGSSSPFGGDGAAPYAGNVEAFEYTNSWGDYLGSTNNKVVLADGREYTLPEGAYLSRPEEIESELRQQDTFAFYGVKGLVAETLQWIFM